jgi:hypothetical protein
MNAKSNANGNHVEGADRSTAGRAAGCEGEKTHESHGTALFRAAKCVEGRDPEGFNGFSPGC